MSMANALRRRRTLLIPLLRREQGIVIAVSIALDNTRITLQKIMNRFCRLIRLEIKNIVRLIGSANVNVDVVVRLGRWDDLEELARQQNVERQGNNAAVFSASMDRKNARNLDGRFDSSTIEKIGPL
jgi:hypothetical protein